MWWTGYSPRGQTGWKGRLDTAIDVERKLQDNVKICEYINFTAITEVGRQKQSKIVSLTWANLVKEGILTSKEFYKPSLILWSIIYLDHSGNRIRVRGDYALDMMKNGSMTWKMSRNQVRTLKENIMFQGKTPVLCYIGCIIVKYL